MKQRGGYATSLAVLVAVNTLNFYDRGILGALAEPIRKEFHLSDAQLGLIGSVFIWLYAIAGLPLGRLADTGNRRKLLAAGMVVWSALTGVAALASTYTLLLCSRLGFALGEAVVAPVSASWIGDMCPAWERSRALALFMLGVPVGTALTFFVSGSIAQHYGWRAAMVLAAAPALVLVPMILSLEEPQRGAAELHREAAGALSMLGILRIPTMWWIILSGALLNFVMYAITAFLPAFFGRIHRLTLAESGVGSGIVFAAGGAIGGFLAARVGDRIIRQRNDGRLLGAAVTALIGAPFAYCGISAGGTVAAVALITIAYGFLNSYYGLVYAAIQDIVPPTMRGTAMAIYFMAMYVCGASFGPVLTGRVSDLMARRAASAAGSGVITEMFKAVGLQQAMLMIPVLAMLLSIVLYCGSRTIIADMRKREAPAS